MASEHPSESPQNGGNEKGGDLLAPLAIPIEEFVKDDRAVQARAMAHLVAMMEQPIKRKQPRSGVVQIDPSLARLRVEIAKHLTGLVPEAAPDAPHAAPEESAPGTEGALRRTG